MVHGAFCGGWVFENFRAPFEAAGHVVLTPDLRGHGVDEPSSAVVGVSMSDYARDIDTPTTAEDGSSAPWPRRSGVSTTSEFFPTL